MHLHVGRVGVFYTSHNESKMESHHPKKPQARKMIHEVEEPLLGLHALEEKLVAQQSTSDQVFHVNGQV